LDKLFADTSEAVFVARNGILTSGTALRPATASQTGVVSNQNFPSPLRGWSYYRAPAAGFLRRRSVGPPAQGWVEISAGEMLACGAS